MTNFSNLLNIILVHGLWGNAGHWSGVISELGHKGYTVDNLQALDLGLLSLESDAARLKTAIDSKNGSVLLVGHSYGGEVITMAGDDPKVKGLVYIAALALDQGESLATIQAQYPPVGADNIYVDSDNYVWIQHDKFRETFCQDLSEAEAFPLNVGQHAPLANVLTDNVTTVAWKTKPSWYQVSTNNNHETRLIPGLDAGPHDQPRSGGVYGQADQRP